MADRIGFRVEGLSQVVRALNALGADTEDLKEAFSEIATEGARIASAAAPRQSGALAADIRGNRAKSKAVVTAGRAAVPYAGPINYGWPRRNIEAAGFMQTASDAMEPRAVGMLEDAINAKIREKNIR